MELKVLLSNYEKYAGQKVNYDKSELTSSPNLDTTYVTTCSHFLGMEWTQAHYKYLGVPLLAGIRKKEGLKAIEDKLEKRIQNFRSMALSWAGREIILKACLQSIPIYFMSCFRLPSAVCKGLTSSMIKFWWGGGPADRKVHWLCKDILLKKKVDGGLGFRSLESFNSAMLMKQLWRILRNPNSLLYETLKAKYFRNGDLLSCRSRPNDSKVWKSLCGVMEIFKSGLRTNEEEAWLWKYDPSGEFSVKSGYNLAHQWELSRSSLGETSNMEGLNNMWSKLWSSNVSNSIKLVTWRLYYDGLPTAENLRSRGCNFVEECGFCGFRIENAKHLFLECWWTANLWKSLNIKFWNVEDFASISDWIWTLLCTQDSETIRKTLVTVWVIWKNRNQILHNKTGWTLAQCAFKTESLLILADKKHLSGLIGQARTHQERNGRLTLYCDGSWSQVLHKGGFAAVGVKNSVIKGCWIDNLPRCESPVHAEIHGIVAGLELAEVWGVTDVDICSDSTTAIWHIMSGTCDADSITDVLQRGSLLLQKHPSWNLLHILRGDNCLADSLARNARENDWCWKMTDSIPRCIQNCLSLCSS